MNCDRTDCENYKPKPALDPISGLVARYKPSTPLPEGAVLVFQGFAVDNYWTTDGNLYLHVHPNGDTHNDVDVVSNVFAIAARYLGLPLAGDDLAEGEEAWTDERLIAAYKVGSVNPTKWSEPYLYAVGHNIGLDNLRRWKHGWICRRIAQPALDLVDLGECFGWKALWRPKRGHGDVILEKEGELRSFDPWNPDPRMRMHSDANLERNALRTAYLRAVDKGLATLPPWWECLMDEIPSKMDEIPSKMAKTIAGLRCCTRGNCTDCPYAPEIVYCMGPLITDALALLEAHEAELAAAVKPWRESESRERLAAYAHEAWSGWMRYLFEKSVENSDGSVTIPAWAVERWKRQSATKYDTLPEAEKSSDRDEADAIYALLEKYHKVRYEERRSYENER